MALLGQLRLFQRALAVLEVGAGILPVHVKEKIVELSGQVIVMCDVVLGLAHGIVLMHTPQQLSHPACDGMQRLGFHVPQIARGDRQQIVDGSFLDLQRPIHVGLPDLEVGIHGNGARHRT